MQERRGWMGVEACRKGGGGWGWRRAERVGVGVRGWRRAGRAGMEGWCSGRAEMGECERLNYQKGKKEKGLF